MTRLCDTQVNKINYIYNNNNLFIITIYVPCGSIYEHFGKNKNKKVAGMSHFLEHLLFKHTEKYTGAHILKEFTRIGGYYNASTDKDETMYYVKTLTENYKVAVDLLYDIVVKPVFLPDDVNAERKVVLEELAQTLDDFTDTIYEQSTSTIIQTKNIYYPSVIGKKTHLQDLTIKDIVSFYKQHYNNFLVVINCDPDKFTDISQYINEKFGKTHKGVCFDESKPLKLSQLYQRPEKMIRVEVNDTYQYNTSILFPSFKYADVEKNNVLNFVKFCLTNAGLYSILSYEIREKRGLVYSIKMNNETMRYLGIVRITFATSNKDTVNILAIIMNIMQHLKKKGLTRKQLAYFKESYTNHMQYKFTNEEYRASWYGDNLFYGVIQTEHQLLKSIQNITNENVKNICQQVFDFDTMGVYTNGNYDNTQKLSNNIRSLFCQTKHS